MFIQRNEVDQPKGLIDVLLDQSAPLGDRDDAAMDLHVYDEPEVEEALLSVVLNHTEEEMLADSAGESLGEIWRRKGKYDLNLVAKMHVAAQVYFKEP
jgi:hypothetical protein